MKEINFNNANEGKQFLIFKCFSEGNTFLSFQFANEGIKF